MVKQKIEIGNEYLVNPTLGVTWEVVKRLRNNQFRINVKTDDAVFESVASAKEILKYNII